MAKDIIREDARLIILKELEKQGNYSLNDSLLSETLLFAGISKSRDWVREELNYLDNVGAITRSIFGSVVVARLTPKGLEHVERRLVIEGVKRPSPVED
ncbi:MAG: VpaChn25_0724 family phage protein [Afipia sp.]